MFSPSQLPSQKVVFTVAQGEGVNQISQNLRNNKLINNSFIFETYVWALRSENKIIAGRYDLYTGYNMVQITNILMGGEVRSVDSITLIEGWNRQQYAKRIDGYGLDGQLFLDLTASTTMWRDDYPLLASIPVGQSLEGYLFPDTYALDSQSTVPFLLNRMLQTFDTRLSQDLLDDIVAGERTLYEVATVASIIENEVSDSEQRRMVAGVFYNRLAIGMGLQSDATINFITGKGQRRPSLGDLEIDSPYNTYKYRGLPPGPIGNPSLDSLTAAIRPAEHDYLYFLHNQKGEIFYARTFEEHQRNRQLYLD